MTNNVKSAIVTPNTVGIGGLGVGTGLPASWNKSWNRLVQGEVGPAGSAPPLPDPEETYALRFKGQIVIVRLPKGLSDFFADTTAVTIDEMKFLEIIHPEQHKKIREAWIAARIRDSAEKEFDND